MIKHINILFNKKILLLLLLLIIIYYSFEKNIDAKKLYNDTSLKTDGFIVKNINSILNDNFDLNKKKK